jgi:alpha-D-ribose 1-methylphosphonate 5-triphosphate diphosphatase
MLVIKGSDVLLESGFERCDIGVSRARTGAGVHLGPPVDSARTVLDAAGLLALPGVIDIHGDAFERQIMPRPNVRFDMNIALRDTDRQLAANGITTAFHGLTWSWEPGFRGADSARIFVDAVESVRPHCLVDHRIHLRQETFNLDAEDEIINWLQHGKIDMLAFNDHLTGTIKVRHRPEKIGDMMRRTGLSEAAFLALVDQCASREHEVAGSIRRLTMAAKAADVPTLSHDDLDIESRTRFREIGIGIAEFPVTKEVAQAASLAGDEIVFGAPNVLRGGNGSRGVVYDSGFGLLLSSACPSSIRSGGAIWNPPRDRLGSCFGKPCTRSRTWRQRNHRKRGARRHRPHAPKWRWIGGSRSDDLRRRDCIS